MAVEGEFPVRWVGGTIYGLCCIGKLKGCSTMNVADCSTLGRRSGRPMIVARGMVLQGSRGYSDRRRGSVRVRRDAGNTPPCRAGLTIRGCAHGAGDIARPAADSRLAGPDLRDHPGGGKAAGWCRRRVAGLHPADRRGGKMERHAGAPAIGGVEGGPTTT